MNSVPLSQTSRCGRPRSWTARSSARITLDAAWDTEMERLSVGETRSVGLEIEGEDEQDGRIVVSVDPAGPVELVRASVGASIQMPMFSSSELSYEYTEPEGTHLIQLQCVRPGTISIIASGLFVRDNGAFLIPAAPQTDLQVECLPNPDAGLTDAGGMDAGVPAVLPYRYVMIVDKEDPSTSSNTMTAGVDLFGVQVNSGGVVENASTLELCSFGPGDNSAATDCNQVIGAPASSCSPDTGDFVALGGTGATTAGRLIVSFGSADIIEGSTITVHECGSAQNPMALDEFYDSFVGVEPVADSPHWVQCHNNATSVASCTVPSLPPVPAP